MSVATVHSLADPAMKVGSDVKQEKYFDDIRVHDEFNDSDADVSFRSVDGVVFRLHKVNLSVTTGGFPLDFIRGPMRDEYLYVDLAETADTLELLFGFVYPRMHKTNIGIMDFDTLAALASAAEKYQVFVAMDVCQVRMAEQVQLHPIEVLNYAFKNGYEDLADLAAVLTVDQPLDTILASLSPDLIVPWLHYYNKWMRIVTIEEIRERLDLHGHWTAAGVICPHFQQTVTNLEVPQCVRHAMTTVLLNTTWGFSCDENCRETWREVARFLQTYISGYASTFRFGSTA